nr:hypothetical protein [Pandoravirus aubagnensis]
MFLSFKQRDNGVAVFSKRKKKRPSQAFFLLKGPLCIFSCCGFGMQRKEHAREVAVCIFWGFLCVDAVCAEYHDKALRLCPIAPRQALWAFLFVHDKGTIKRKKTDAPQDAHQQSTQLGAWLGRRAKKIAGSFVGWQGCPV